LSHQEQQKPQPVRVLIIAASLDILGGQAVQAQRLIQHLQNEPSLEVSFLPINPRLPGALRKLQSIKYVRTVSTSILYCLKLLTQVWKYDVIHIFSAAYLSFLIAPTPAILIGKLYGKKVLLNYHSGEAEDHLRRFGRTHIPIMNLADKVVVPSEFLVKVFSRFGIEATAIFNDIDVNRFEFRQRAPLRPVFLSNRNLQAHYGVDCVLRAFALIQQQVPEAALTVVGYGKQYEALQSLKSELNLKNISFTGRIEHEDIYQHYSNADIFLNASKVDNQPLSILEAFACGLPVVTTNAGGIPYMVTDGETGFVVPVGDYRALADRALELLTRQNTATMVQRARAEVMRYTWEVVSEQWRQLYHDLAQK
jgi:glycosyltransferase involved in cell wall biosynthesis